MAARNFRSATYSGEENHEEENDLVELFPNPTQEELLIHNTKNVKEVIVFTNSGQAMISKKASNESPLKLDVSDIAKGLYVLKVTKHDGTIQTKKFVKE